MEEMVMHEHSITNEVVHQIVHACEDKDITPKKIKVKLGVLTTYKKDSVLLYFEGHKKEIDILKDCELDIEEVPGKIVCNECKKESKVEPSPLILCPFCDSADIKVIQGDKVVIAEII
ncbi:hydrogenase maturation nickel metallochaperone HypA [Candidatus Woesearchaeota archaeon]|nr:hydrogenase maturation nickel metallochaperone HypA [Candidatus Woesearchaeota archaeon]